MKIRKLSIALLSLVLAAGLTGLTGCKKKPPQEEPVIEEPVIEEVVEEEPPPPPPPPPKPKPKPARPSLQTLNSQLTTIHFDFDKSDLRNDMESILDANAALMKKYPKLEVIIGGHCDERGTIEYNLALGDRRSNTAKQGLLERGIAAGRIRTISYGEEQPADPAHNEAAWAKNRRAEFEFVERR